MLGQDYWLILSTPVPGVTGEDIQASVAEHVQWLLALEEQHTIFLSGPLLEGPGVGPGSGVTVVRATDEAEATRVVEQDPFVKAGLRTFTVYRWRLNEGSIGLRVSLGTGRYDWQ